LAVSIVAASDWLSIRTLFEQAMDLPAAERAAFLERSCAGDDALRSEVEAMLAADVRAAREKTGLGGAAPDLLRALNDDERDEQRDRLVGLRLGHWRLLREIGRGGMGAVYLAERDDGEYTQQAAIKLVRPGWDVGELLQRFRAERQILATLNHPNIARLLDGGVSDDGKPYLVLEYIEGSGIGRYCNEHQLGIEARLRLFLTVCEAVTHAHRRLVVHRDLKPSNIMIDTSGQVKLLDFGIAKLIEADGGVTATSARMFTPEYAAPEQVRGEAVTTGVDVYALGLLLFDLLTGRRPYGATATTPAAYEQAILTQEPQRPSQAAVQDDAEAATRSAEHAAARNLDPAQLSALLRGDLDAIVLKALRKEPEQRYASVAEFAGDILCHLQRQPVAARRGNLRYRMTRFLQRHALATALAALAVFSLLAGLGVALWQADVARDERDLARREALKSRQALKFMAGVFQLADPSESLGKSITAVDLLRKGRLDIEAQLHDEPEVRAELLISLGDAYMGLGLSKDAKSLYQAALSDARGLESPRLMGTAMSALSHAINRLGDHAASEAMKREALELPLASDVAGETLRAELEMGLGTLVSARSGFPEAEVWFRQGRERYRRATGQTHWESVIPFSSLLHSTGRAAEAETLLTEALAEARKTLPAVHPARASLSAQLAINHSRQGRPKQAEPLLREALAVKIAIYGEEHPAVDITRHNLARTLAELGQWQDAEALFRRVIDSETRRYSAHHTSVAAGQAGLARTLLDSGRAAQAEPYWRAAQATASEKFGPLDSAVGITAIGLGRTLLELGRFDEASEALDLAERVYIHLGENGTGSLALTRLAQTRISLARNAPEPDCSLARQALAALVKPGVNRAYAQAVLGACLQQVGRHDQALPLLMEGNAQLRTLQGTDWPERRFAEAELARIRGD
jgi:eukaryotic-like serine/threonine-protein kinase